MPLSRTGVVTGKSSRPTGYLPTTMKVFTTFNKPRGIPSHDNQHCQHRVHFTVKETEAQGDNGDLHL